MCPLNPAYHLSLKFGGVDVKSAFAGVAGKSRQKPVGKKAGGLFKPVEKSQWLFSYRPLPALPAKAGSDVYNTY